MRLLVDRNTIWYDVILVLCFTISLIFDNALIYTIGAVLVWVSGFIYCLKNINKRFTLFCFLIGFMIFLMGGYIAYYITTGTFNYFDNSNQAVLHTCRSLYLSLSVVLIISTTSRSNDSIQENMASEKNENPVKYNVSEKVIQFIVLMLVVAFLCKLLESTVSTIYLSSVNYYTKDTSAATSSLPSFVTYLSSYFYILLFIYWSMFPSKRGTIISMIALLTVEVIILVSGERGEPMSLIAAMVYYLMVRYKAGYRDIVPPKKVIVVFVLMIPLLMGFLQELAFTRSSEEVVTSDYGIVYDFFQSQGVSSKVIANGYDDKERVTEIGGNTYILGEIRSYLTYNVFTRILFGTKEGDYVDQAYSGNSYSATLNYLELSSYSLENGVGGGTAYIAEAFQDGGYLLLILFNIFLSFLIKKVDNCEYSSGPLRMAIYLNIFRYMVLIPRGYCLAWLTNSFAIQNLVLYVFVYFLLGSQEGASVNINKNEEEAL